MTVKSRAGQGRAGQEQGRAGQGGAGRAGQGRAGQGRAGQGRRHSAGKQSSCVPPKRWRPSVRSIGVGIQDTTSAAVAKSR